MMMMMMILSLLWMTISCGDGSKYDDVYDNFVDLDNLNSDSHHHNNLVDDVSCCCHLILLLVVVVTERMVMVVITLRFRWAVVVN